jgi:RNA polymerase sigma factor (sigma-70 family)
MAEASDFDLEQAKEPSDVAASDLSAWFIREIFPLEAVLMQFLQRYWRNESDLADLRQEVYVRLYEAAKTKRPHPVKPFMLTVARNLVIDKVRKEQVVPIEAVTDLEALNVALDVPGPDRAAISRDELRRLQFAINRLSPRYREAIVLAQVEGISAREVRERKKLQSRLLWPICRDQHWDRRLVQSSLTFPNRFDGALTAVIR